MRERERERERESRDEIAKTGKGKRTEIPSPISLLPLLISV